MKKIFLLYLLANFLLLNSCKDKTDKIIDCDSPEMSLILGTYYGWSYSEGGMGLWHPTITQSPNHSAIIEIPGIPSRAFTVTAFVCGRNFVIPKQTFSWYYNGDMYEATYTGHGNVTQDGSTTLIYVYYNEKIKEQGTSVYLLDRNGHMEASKN